MSFVRCLLPVLLMVLCCNKVFASNSGCDKFFAAYPSDSCTDAGYPGQFYGCTTHKFSVKNGENCLLSCSTTIKFDGGWVNYPIHNSRTYSQTTTLVCPKNTVRDSESCSCEPIPEPDCPDADAVGDPMLPATGRHIETETDFQSAGLFPLLVQRYYESASKSTVAGMNTDASGTWHFNNMQQLLVHDILDASDVYLYTRLTFVRGNGFRYVFQSNANGGYTSVQGKNPNQVQKRFDNAQNFIGWTFSTPAGEEWYDTGGNLLKEITLTGLSHSFTNQLTQAPFSIVVTDDQTGFALTYSIVMNAGIRQVNSVTLPDEVTSVVYDYQNTSPYMLHTVTYANGAIRTYSYADINGDETISFVENNNYLKLLTSIDENGVRYASWTYNADGRVLSSENGSRNSGIYKTSISYPSIVSDVVKQVVITNASGQTTTRYYTDDANGTNQLMQSNGAVATGGCLATNSDFTYNSDGYHETTTDSLGYVAYKKHSTDGRGLLQEYWTAMRWPNNVPGVPAQLVAQPESQRVETDWHTSLAVPTERRYYGYTAGAWVRYRTVNFTYDNKNNLYSRMETDNLPTAAATRTTYYTNTYYGSSSVLQQTEITDPRGNETLYDYNSNGQLTSMALPTENGVTQTFTYANYNSFGKPQTITDVANNIVTTLVYDTANGRLNSSTVAGATTDITYWPTNGLVRKVTSPDGSWLEYSYNSAHQLVRVDNQKSEYIIYTPSLLNGEWTDAQTYSASAAITAQQHRLFDALGRTWKQLDAASTPKVVYGYDQNDNLTNIIELGDGSNTPTYDNNSRVSYRTYDGQQRLSSETHCANTATTPPLICSGSPLLTSYTYDIQGNIATVTDANSHVTSYSYNGFGERVQQISPDTGTTQYEYSLAGNLITKTKALGTADAQVIAYEWDALNRLTLINYPGTTKDVTYTWDENSHGISKGRLTTVADASGVTGYSYNGHGLVTSKQQTPTGSGHTFTTQYGYTANDTQLDTTTLPSLEQIKYNRSGADISSITNLTSNTNGSANIVTAILHRPFGNATGWQTNSGGYYKQQRSYDQNGRLASRAIIDGNDGAVAETYEHDSYGDISAMRRTGHPEHDEVYEYSPLAQLTKVTAQYGRITYGYDNVGNRSSRLMERQDPATQAWQEFYTEAYGTNPNNNRLNSITRTRGGNPLRSRSFGYDARGNITSDARSKTENSTTTTDTLLLQYGESDRLNSIDVQ